jgi:cell wall-associated NlpC family hydrolase
VAPPSARNLARGLAALSIALFAGLLPSVQAQAAPTPSVSEIEKQLDEAWQKIEPLVEQYNKVHAQLLANQAKSKDLQKRMTPLELQVDLAMTKVGDIAAQQYKFGAASGINALLSSASDSPTTLGEQLATLDFLARSQKKQISGVSAARDKYDAEKTKIDSLIETQKVQDADLAAKKKTIQAQIDSLQKMRLTAYGSSSSGGALRIGPCPADYIGGAAGTAVNAACDQIGKPYVWNADGPGSFDCSGLTKYAWGKAGVSLTHFTGAQWSQGKAVSRANARPGDLVFFYSDVHHVGIYVGNGLMVHAPTPGTPVKMAKIDNMPVAGFRRPG